MLITIAGVLILIAVIMMVVAMFLPADKMPGKWYFWVEFGAIAVSLGLVVAKMVMDKTFIL